MKKITILLLLITLNSHAQKYLTAKGGLSFNDNHFGSSKLYEPSGKTSYYAGVGLEYKMGSFGAEGELHLTNGGSENDITATGFNKQAQLNFKNTVNLVLFGKYYATEYVTLKAGGYAGRISSAKYEYDNKEYDYKSSVKSFDYGVAIGIEVNIYKGLFFETRYLIGLANLNDVGKSEAKTAIKNRFYQMGLGYRFTL